MNEKRELEKEKVLHKEIDLVQSCINRMAKNSFSIKGWLVAFITVLLTMLPEKINISVLYGIIFVSTLCFWYLDAFYLRMERLYRWKYEWIIAKRLECDNDFFDLNPMNQDMWLPNKDGSKKKPRSVVRIMFTKSLVPIYFIIMICTTLCLSQYIW